MGISFSAVIENGLVSEDVIDCIVDAGADVCACGTETEFTESLKQIYCPNRFCFYKVAARLEAMANTMKADGFGESTCQEICRVFKLKSPYQIFLLEGKTCNTVSAFEKKMKSICDATRRRVKLWEVVRLAGIPSIETIAYKIFDGYDTLSDAYADIEKLQVPFIAERLGLRNPDTGVLAVNIYNTLLEYKDELLFGETKFSIYKPVGETMCIAITGGVYGYPNKSEFINFINTRYSEKINAMLMNSVTNSVQALVSDGDTSSNKYKTACRLRDKGSDIMVTDSTGLIAWLDKKYLTSENL